MPTPFRRLMASLAAGFSLLAIPAATAHAAASRTTTPQPSRAAPAPVAGLRPLPIPPVGTQASASRSGTVAPNDTLGSCYDHESMQSIATGNWVSAEVEYPNGDYGMLRARASDIGPWEQFSLCKDLSTGNWVIISDQNNDYVSAELGYPTTDPRYGMLRARATQIGPWEQFNLYCTQNPQGTNTTLVIYSTANGNWVSAEFGYSTTDSRYGMLRTRPTTTNIGPWEQFTTTTPNSFGC